MNASVQRALDKYELYLQTLIESVSSYNPSPAAAQALIQADDELTATLEKLQEHQQAHAQILALGATSNALDERLTELLTTLSESRQLLLTVPATRFPAATAGSSISQSQPREISYRQLLSYASKISKFSRPPNPAAFKKLANAVLPPSSLPQQQQQTQLQLRQQRPGDGDGDATEAKPAEDGEAKLPLGLSEEDLPQLDPSGMMPFTPWPNEVVMKQGALALLGPHGVPEDMVPEDQRPKADAREDEAKKREGDEVKREKGVANGSPGGANREQQQQQQPQPQQQQRAPAQREKPARKFSLDLYQGED